MKAWILMLATAFFLSFCTQKKQNYGADRQVIQNDAGTQTDSNSFFPVTNFLQGELNQIKNGGINPLKITTIAGKTDSVWLKMEELDLELHEFFQPVIDTANLSTLFTQSSFLDRTLNAYTFTYEPRTTLSDSMELQRWDVYVNPSTSKVTRIYMIKNKPGAKQLQLTWLSGWKASMVELESKANGSSSVNKETVITWNLDK